MARKLLIKKCLILGVTIILYLNLVFILQLATRGLSNKHHLIFEEPENVGFGHKEGINELVESHSIPGKPPGSMKLSPKENVNDVVEIVTVPEDILKVVKHDEWLCKTIVDKQGTCVKKQDSSAEQKSGNNCTIPILNPFHPSIMRQMSNVPKPDCSSQRSYGSFENGKLTFNDDTVVSATYRAIIRNGDFNTGFGPIIPIEEDSIIMDPFIIVDYKLKNNRHVRELFMQPILKKQLSTITKKPGIPLNILIIGIDSLSHSNAKRKLPKLYKFLEKDFGAHIFNGHSIVGDGTTEQLSAMLTGLGELEQYESRRHHKNPKPVDGWNWIYKQMKEHGYLTGYSGDNPSIGPFQYRLMGFKDEPTDFYTRPFYQNVLKIPGRERGGRNKCIGRKTITKFQFDYIDQVFRKFPEQLKFFFSFNVEYSHNTNSEASMVEPDLLAFLKQFRQEGYLNNTLLIVMGDHGSRYGEVRTLMQGKLEERLPLFTMTFPSWFDKKYPDLSKALARNTQRLTSWYDVYATFRHMISYPVVPKDLKHGNSLFEEIPMSRTCADANVEGHWCPCLKMSPVSVKHSHIINSALAAVQFMNYAIKEHQLSSNHCRILSLKSINYALSELPNDEVMLFRETNDLKPVFSKQSMPKHDSFCRYQLQFTTSPNNGVYEATVRYHKNWFIVSKDISRVNKYGEQPSCIARELPHLRKFCFCST